MKAAEFSPRQETVCGNRRATKMAVVEGSEKQPGAAIARNVTTVVKSMWMADIRMGANFTAFIEVCAYFISASYRGCHCQDRLRGQACSCLSFLFSSRKSLHHPANIFVIPSPVVVVPQTSVMLCQSWARLQNTLTLDISVILPASCCVPICESLDPADTPSPTSTISPPPLQLLFYCPEVPPADCAGQERE